MSKSRRVQILMEPDEFVSLTDIARQRGSTLSALLRDAARAQFLQKAERLRRRQAAEAFLGLPELDLPEWADLEQEVEDRRGAALP